MNLFITGAAKHERDMLNLAINDVFLTLIKDAYSLGQNLNKDSRFEVDLGMNGI